MVSTTGKLESDLRVALLTGAAGWRDRNSNYNRAELTTATVLLALVTAVVTVLLVSAGLPGHDAAVQGGARWLLALVGTVTLLVAIGPSLAWPLGWRPRRAPGPVLTVRPFAVVRVGAVMVLVGCWTALLGPVSFVPVWILGGVVGCEYVLTAWALGVRTGGLSWWRQFQLSGVHAGILLLTAGAVALNPGRWADLLRVPLTFQVIALGGALTCHGLERMRRVFNLRQDQAARTVAHDIHRRIANWLHNEVTSTLRLLRFRLLSGRIGPDELAAELYELDHSLRLRQLDELLASGTARLADVVQPYVRLAQDQGVDVTDVPRLGEPGAVDGETGRLARRVLGVLVPNALAAGATTLAVRAESVPPAGLAIEVEDDAGGFDLATVPAGRGLDNLHRDLGPGSVVREATPRGSRVRVTVTPPGDPGTGPGAPDRRDGPQEAHRAPAVDVPAPDGRHETGPRGPAR